MQLYEIRVEMKDSYEIHSTHFLYGTFVILGPHFDIEGLIQGLDDEMRHVFRVVPLPLWRYGVFFHDSIQWRRGPQRIRRINIGGKAGEDESAKMHEEKPKGRESSRS